MNCGHSKIQKVFGKKVFQNYQSNNFDILQNVQQNYNPIRIFFNTTLLEVGSDPDRTCYSVGQLYKRGIPPDNSTFCNPNQLQYFNCWYTCTSLDVVTAPVSTFYKTIISNVNSTLTSVLNVIPIQGLLTSNLTTCGLSSRYGIQNVQSSALSSGVSGYDLYIFVSLRPMFTVDEGDTVSTECQTDQFGRPTIGQLNINPATTSILPFNIAQGYALHETIHLLGFTLSKFPSYLWPNGTARTNVVQPIPTTFDGETININYLNLPTAINMVQNHFGCSSILGVELEELPTYGSHLEKRLFFNE